MSASWKEKLPQEFTFPALVGLATVVITIVVLFVISSRKTRKFLGGRGTKYVVDEDGSAIVRRWVCTTHRQYRLNLTSSFRTLGNWPAV